MSKEKHPPVHPFGLPLLALVAIIVLEGCYLAFGVGKDALTYAFAMLVVFGLPVVVVFGIAGIVLAGRRLLRRTALNRRISPTLLAGTLRPFPPMR